MSPRKPSIWENPAPYGEYEGARGDAADWRRAFDERFSQTQMRELLGRLTPWQVLGIRAGATHDEIRTAYRRKALETHPDRHPGRDRADFQRVLAAYQSLMRNV